MASSYEVVAFIVITIIVIALIVLLYILDQINKNNSIVFPTGFTITKSQITSALWFGAFAALLGIILWIYIIYLLFAGPTEHVHHTDVSHHDLHYSRQLQDDTVY